MSLRRWLKRLTAPLQRGRDLARRQLGLWCFDRPPSPTQGRPGRIVLVRWDAKLGDAIVSSWFFAALKASRPDVQIEVITTPAMAWLFKEHFGADRVYPCAKRAGYLELARLATQLGEVECLVHFAKQLKMKDLFFLSRVKSQHVAGLDDGVARVDMKLGALCQGRHFADKFWLLAERLGAKPPMPGYQIPRLPRHEQAVEAWWPTQGPVLAINAYGHGGARRLTDESLNRLLDIVARELPEVTVCLLYAPMDRQGVAALCHARGDSRVTYYPQSEHIADTIALIARADALISVDTATVHIAVGLDKPVFGLYNPDAENLADWGPRHARAEVFIAQPVQPQTINALAWPELAQRLPQWWQTQVLPFAGKQTA
ncbi:glycosyltransferase family 9 protein [Pseudaeromonas paramecii]|uniref:Lipopolysaccharide heptosyltransferase family protein n=1 Tax=Pseudaeromonas paramecii TaxID=2138166 RepID=A0ABP8PYS6_9GAMM